MPTASSPFTAQDAAQIRRRGISQKEALRHLALLRTPPESALLDRPCTLGDGIHSLSAEEVRRYAKLFDEARAAGRVMKFVPASGAGTRMFRAVLAHRGADRASLKPRADKGEETAREALEIFENLPRFPFYEAVRAAAAKKGHDAAALLKKGLYAPLAEALLAEIEPLPKALVPVHQGGKTPLEEHLAEAAALLRDKDGVCRLHVTVSEEHLTRFRDLMIASAPKLEKELKAKFKVEFSVQKRSTDTLAADLKDKPFRLADGSLLFRPAGHGALLENLQASRGDVVFVRNIDNVAPEGLREETLKWKRALGGMLIELQNEIARCARWLASKPEDDQVIDQAFRLLLGRLSIAAPDALKKAGRDERRRFLLSKLNRPVRVCGVVENSGEPGGGPFWVKRKGEVSLQIVERAQVSERSKEQQSVFASATHFNPVDLACGLRDPDGRPYDLRRHVDEEAVFVSRKSEDGRELKALERPGLWNGGMADWNTVFVEVPASTFHPIKTLKDLLREGHQS
jgi:hypothetical protein